MILKLITFFLICFTGSILVETSNLDLMGTSLSLALVFFSVGYGCLLARGDK
jgi:hypothetical protein